MADSFSKGHLLAVGAVTAVGVAVGYFVGRRTTSFTKRNFKSHMADDPLYKYISDHSLRLAPAQKKLIEITKAHPGSRMLGSADELQFLQQLVKLINAKKTLDIGVFTGYSALSIAMVLPPDGTVVACDVREEFANVGKPFWKEAGVDQKIDLRIAPAKDTLEALLANGEAGTYDFAFIDADKPNYDNYYELCLKLVRPGGIIALDNVLWGGRVAEPSVQDKDTNAIRAINEKLFKDDRVDISMLALGDGTTLVFTK